MTRAEAFITICCLILYALFPIPGCAEGDSHAQAVKLLEAASVKPSDYWYETATLLGRKGHQALWNVWGASTPVRDIDSICTSLASDWHVTTDDSAHTVVAGDPGAGVIAYLENDTGKKCTEYPASEYTDMIGRVSNRAAIDAIKDIRATIKCFAATGETRCGLWHKAEVPNDGEIREYFLNSHDAKVTDVTRYDDGSIEVAFDNPKGDRYDHTDIPGPHSVCTVRFENDGSRDLEISMDAGGPF